MTRHFHDEAPAMKRCKQCLQDTTCVVTRKLIAWQKYVIIYMYIYNGKRKKKRLRFNYRSLSDEQNLTLNLSYIRFWSKFNKVILMYIAHDDRVNNSLCSLYISFPLGMQYITRIVQYVSLANDRRIHFLLNKSWRYLELTFRILISLARRFWVLEIFFFAITLMATTKSSFCSNKNISIGIKRKDIEKIQYMIVLGFLPFEWKLNFKSL